MTAGNGHASHAERCSPGAEPGPTGTSREQAGEGSEVADGPVTAIIAGVNKAGTTSLFVSLRRIPTSRRRPMKETRYFLPAR